MIQKFHLAQINVGRIVGGNMQDPLMKTFVDLLDEINALAESSPGFIWRLKDEDNNATSINPFGDERVIINMSVWESLQDLENFVYRSTHVEVLKRRKEWFEKFGKQFMALWYVPSHHTPTVDEAVAKLDQLEKAGPCAEVFNFRMKFDPPSNPIHLQPSFHNPSS
jgi:hypothetical protein